MMIWESIEVIPVVKDDLTLIGIVSRQDILKSMQMIQKQPQVGETIDDTIANQLSEKQILVKRRITNLKLARKWLIRLEHYRTAYLHK